MATPPLETLPGFRRRIIITPGPGWVRAEVEDDYHCMSVVVRHDGGIARAIEPVVSRAPWTTCPGAVVQLTQTFANVPLDAFATRGGKAFNCTHLHDLAILAAGHASDELPLVYDIFVSDLIDGQRRAELRRNARTIMRWVHENGRLLEPAELAGTSLYKMRSWIETLDQTEQEEARLFRWGIIIANGRTIPLELQSDATRMPANCYTFQPQNANRARRIGEIRDFSSTTAQPLEGRDGVGTKSS